MINIKNRVYFICHNLIRMGEMLYEMISQPEIQIENFEEKCCQISCPSIRYISLQLFLTRERISSMEKNRYR